jgi:3-methyladenine DNA glycosylase Mpg
MADLFLNRVTLFIAGASHRLIEIEIYYRGGHHWDDFTHADPIQTNFGIWYFHRTGGEYRGGTYKGLDISIGEEDAHGGVLIRGVERLSPPAALLDGPCVAVDHILALNKSPSIKELVSRFDLRIDAPEEPGTSPLYIALDEGSRGKEIYESPRVGLTLKRGDIRSRQRFIARGYRFLTEPALTRKGKVQLILGLHRQGRSAAEIGRITGSTGAVIRKYLQLYEAGQQRSPGELGGAASSEDLCQLLGACEAW